MRQVQARAESDLQDDAFDVLEAPCALFLEHFRVHGEVDDVRKNSALIEIHAQRPFPVRSINPGLTTAPA